MPGSTKQDLIDHIIGGALQQTAFMNKVNTDADKIINDAIQLKDKPKPPAEKKAIPENKLKDVLGKPPINAPPVIPQSPLQKALGPPPVMSPPVLNNKINENKEIYDKKLAETAAEKGRKQAEVNAKAAQMESKMGRLIFLVTQNLGTIHLALVFIAIIALICSFLASILFVVILVVSVINKSDDLFPLNTATVEFEIVKSFTRYSGKFNYLLLVLLPFISLCCIIAVFVLSYTILPPPFQLGGEAKGVLAAIGILAFIVAGLQFLANLYLGSKIRAVSAKVSHLNDFIYNNYTKNPLILPMLTQPQNSLFSLNSIMKDCLAQITMISSEKNIAKIFFTITMLFHYHKLGTREEYLFNALQMFRIPNMLLRLISPSDFFPRYGTYVSTIEPLIKSNISEELWISSKTKIDKAFSICRGNISKVNELANTIYPETAFLSFAILAAVSLAIQGIPVLAVIIYMMGGIGANSFIAKFIAKITG
jgi:hypothetical protein